MARKTDVPRLWLGLDKHCDPSEPRVKLHGPVRGSSVVWNNNYVGLCTKEASDGEEKHFRLQTIGETIMDDSYIERPSGEGTTNAEGYSEQVRTPRTKNSDNEWLGTVEAGGACIGHVDEVNGLGAKEVEGFVPTRHELLTLVKYFAKTAIEDEYFCFLYACSGSTESRRIAFAWRRVARIKQLLGNSVDQAVDQVYKDFEKTEDQRYWKVFLSGSEQERHAVQEEIWREIESCTDSSNPPLGEID